MTKHKNGKRYNDDFRKMVVDLYESGQSVRNLSSEYGVSEVTIYAWIKKFTPMDLEDGASITSDDYVKSLTLLTMKKIIIPFNQCVMSLVYQGVRTISH